MVVLGTVFQYEQIHASLHGRYMYYFKALNILYYISTYRWMSQNPQEIKPKLYEVQLLVEKRFCAVAR